MELLALLVDIVLNGFAVATGVLLASWLGLPGRRPLIRQLLAFSNVLLLVGATLFLLTELCQLLTQLRGGEYEQYVLLNRLTGPYWFAYWGMVLCKGLLPQLLWLRRLRRSLGAGLALVPGLLVEYWLPLLSAAHRDYLPASWVMLRPDWYALGRLSLTYLLLYALLFAVARWLGLAGGGK